MARKNHKNKINNKLKRKQITWFSLFQVCIIIISLILTASCLVLTYHSKQAVEDLQSRITALEKQNSSSDLLTNEDKLIEYINIIDNKADVAIDRVVAIVGVLFTVVTLFGGFIAFKAPKDIDSRLAEVDKEIEKAKSTTEEARYLIAIREALQENTTVEKISALTAIIDNYPSYSEAYYHRGCLWDKIKKYDKAIEDYKSAKNRGLDLEVYYNCIAVAFDKKGNKKQAIIFYTKAIETQETDESPEFLSQLYSNRGSCFDDIDEYELAIKDYEHALLLNSESDFTLQNRSVTYRNLAEKQTDFEEKLKYYRLAQNDLMKAIRINSEKEELKRSLISVCLEVYGACQKVAEKETQQSKKTELLNCASASIAFARQLVSTLSLSKENIKLESKTIQTLLKRRETSEDQQSFTIVDDEGKRIVCDVLFSFDNEETGKSYIVYTDNSSDEQGNTNVYASVHITDNHTGKHHLETIETEEEWKTIEIILNKLQDGVKKGLDLDKIVKSISELENSKADETIENSEEGQ